MKWFLTIIIPIIMQAQSGLEIAEMLDQKPAPKDLSNKTRMILTNSKGKSRTNDMISKSINKNMKQMIWFLEPRDDRGVAFLKIENNNKEDEMRMWLPAFKRVRRISAKKKGDSFMGSDLSYEDLSNRNLDDNTYKHLRDNSFDGIDCHVLEITPKKNARSSYGKHISWIEKGTFNILKEYSYNKKGQLEKEKSFEYDFIKTYYVLKRVFVKNIIKNHTTEIFFTDIVVDSGLESSLFHEKNLKRIPRD